MIHKINNDDSVYVIGQRTKYTKKKIKIDRLLASRCMHSNSGYIFIQYANYYHNVLAR